MKERVISAIIAFIILIPLLIFGGISFAIAVGIIGVLAYKEILDLKKSHNEIPNIIKILGLISIVYIILGDYYNSLSTIIFSYQKFLLPIVLLMLPTVFIENKKYSTKDAFYLLGTIYLIGILFNLIITLRNVNLFLLIYLLSIPIFTDTFAYIIGCAIGKHKMAPLISPKKSWEGAIGGLIGGSIVPIIIYSNLVDGFSIKLVLITIILSVVGQIGDLFYSKIKRENGIKDFSNIMPGHGGILDRVDSLSFVIFTYVLLILFL